MGWGGGAGGGRGSAGAVGSPGRERVQEARERGDTNQRGWGAPRVTPGLGGVRGRRGCGGGSPSPGSVALVLDDDLHAVLAELRPEDQVLALQLLHLTRLGAVRLWGPVLILRQTPNPPRHPPAAVRPRCPSGAGPGPAAPRRGDGCSAAAPGCSRRLWRGSPLCSVGLVLGGEDRG